MAKVTPRKGPSKSKSPRYSPGDSLGGKKTQRKISHYMSVSPEQPDKAVLVPRVAPLRRNLFSNISPIKPHDDQLSRRGDRAVYPETISQGEANNVQDSNLPNQAHSQMKRVPVNSPGSDVSPRELASTNRKPSSSKTFAKQSLKNWQFIDLEDVDSNDGVQTLMSPRSQAPQNGNIRRRNSSETGSTPVPGTSVAENRNEIALVDRSSGETSKMIIGQQNSITARPSLASRLTKVSLTPGESIYIEVAQSSTSQSENHVENPTPAVLSSPKSNKNKQVKRKRNQDQTGPPKKSPKQSAASTLSEIIAQEPKSVQESGNPSRAVSETIKVSSHAVSSNYSVQNQPSTSRHAVVQSGPFPSATHDTSGIQNESTIAASKETKPNAKAVGFPNSHRTKVKASKLPQSFRSFLLKMKQTPSAERGDVKSAKNRVKKDSSALSSKTQKMTVKNHSSSARGSSNNTQVVGSSMEKSESPHSRRGSRSLITSRTGAMKNVKQLASSLPLSSSTSEHEGQAEIRPTFMNESDSPSPPESLKSLRLNPRTKVNQLAPGRVTLSKQTVPESVAEAEIPDQKTRQNLPSRPRIMEKEISQPSTSSTKTEVIPNISTVSNTVQSNSNISRLINSSEHVSSIPGNNATIKFNTRPTTSPYFDHSTEEAEINTTSSVTVGSVEKTGCKIERPSSSKALSENSMTTDAPNLVSSYKPVPSVTFSPPEKQSRLDINQNKPNDRLKVTSSAVGNVLLTGKSIDSEQPHETCKLKKLSPSQATTDLPMNNVKTIAHNGPSCILGENHNNSKQTNRITAPSNNCNQGSVNNAKMEINVPKSFKTSLLLRELHEISIERVPRADSVDTANVKPAKNTDTFKQSQAIVGENRVSENNTIPKHHSTIVSEVPRKVPAKFEAVTIAKSFAKPVSLDDSLILGDSLKNKKDSKKPNRDFPDNEVTKIIDVNDLGEVIEIEDSEEAYVVDSDEIIEIGDSEEIINVVGMEKATEKEEGDEILLTEESNKVNSSLKNATSPMLPTRLREIGILHLTSGDPSANPKPAVVPDAIFKHPKIPTMKTSVRKKESPKINIASALLDATSSSDLRAPPILEPGSAAETTNLGSKARQASQLPPLNSRHGLTLQYNICTPGPSKRPITAIASNTPQNPKRQNAPNIGEEDAGNQMVKSVSSTLDQSTSLTTETVATTLSMVPVKSLRDQNALLRSGDSNGKSTVLSDIRHATQAPTSVQSQSSNVLQEFSISSSCSPLMLIEFAILECYKFSRVAFESNDAILKVATDYLHLQRPDQEVVNYLFKMDGLWIKADSLRNNLPDNLKSMDALYEKGLIEDLQLADLKNALISFKNSELVKLCSLLKLKKRGSRGKLVSALQEKLSVDEALTKAAFDSLGKLIRLSQVSHIALQHLFAASIAPMFLSGKLSFQHKITIVEKLLHDVATGEKSLVRFTLRDFQLFKSDKYFTEYVYSLSLKSMIVAAVAEKNWATGKALAMKALAYWSICANDYNNSDLPTVRQFMPGSNYISALNVGIDVFIHHPSKEYSMAIFLLETLLSQEFHLKHLRGHWCSRKVSIKRKYLKMSVGQIYTDLLEGLKLEDLTPLGRYVLSRKAAAAIKVRRNGLSPEQKKALGSLICVPEDYQPCKEIEYESVASSANVSLIETARISYMGQYPGNFSDKGKILKNVILATFWRIIYAPLDNVFVSNYQYCPLDWGGEDFYKNRSVQLKAHSDLLREGGIDGVMNTLEYVVKTHGNTHSLVDWTCMGAELLPQVFNVLTCLGIDKFLNLADYLLNNYLGRCSNWPDLTLWNTITGSFLFVYVNNAGGNLNAKQYLWMKRIKMMGIDVERCQVSCNVKARSRSAWVSEDTMLSEASQDVF